jgi:RHS repeat-associated protein
MSRRISVSNPAIQAGPLLQQSYTPDGLIASLTDANSNTTSFAPDGFDRLSTTTYPGGSTEVLGYDADGNVLTRKTRAGPTIAFSYDTLNRLSSKTPPSPAPVVTYAYDQASRLIGVGDTSASIAKPATSASYSTSLGYDQLDRPLTVNWTPAPSQTTPTATSASFTFGYDATNRRIGQSATDNSWWSYPATATNVAYIANNLNQYTTVGSVNNVTYDGNGNLAYDGSFSYGYDAENRLISATGSGLTASYAYDAQGRRKSKTVNGTTTIYVTDADNREVLEYDGSSGAIGNWYSYGLGPNNVLNQMNVASGTRATLIPDILGSFIGTLDATSGTLTKFGYQTYGESASTTGSFRYTGQRIDAETGLYYYRARMYAPAWGRFPQPDPIGYRGGSNIYTCVDNDPLNLTDPSGKDPFVGATVGLIAGAYYGALGAAGTPGATWKSVLVGAGVGGAVGAGVGALDPSLGVYTLAVVGGVAAGASDIAGQVVTNALTANPLGNINYGSTAGAVIGGAIGGAGGTVLGGLAAKGGISELAGTTISASISSGPGTVLPAVGGAIWDYLTGGAKGSPSTTANPGAASQGSTSAPLELGGATATGQSLK